MTNYASYCRPSHCHGRPADQSGVVLVVSMIILLLLTIVVSTATQTSTLEEKMAGNLRDSNLAFQAAESALSAGEIAAATVTPTIVCPNPGTNPAGYYLPFDVDCNGIQETTPVWENAAIWSDDAKSLKFDEDGNAATIDLNGLNANPRYIVEDMGTSCASATPPCPAADQRHNYRVTSRARGGTSSSFVMLQSNYQVEAP